MNSAEKKLTAPKGLLWNLVYYRGENFSTQHVVRRFHEIINTDGRGSVAMLVLNGFKISPQRCESLYRCFMFQSLLLIKPAYLVTAGFMTSQHLYSGKLGYGHL